MANRLGTNDARTLAAELVRWHDAMVIHLRSSSARYASDCQDDCPHDQALALWLAARDVFGDDADELHFLRRFGALTNHCDGLDGVAVHA